MIAGKVRSRKMNANYFTEKRKEARNELWAPSDSAPRLEGSGGGEMEGRGGGPVSSSDCRGLLRGRGGRSLGEYGQISGGTSVSVRC